jgi:ABC-2 type transport system permease protein
MNVFFRELKAHRKGILFWSVGMFLMIWVSMVKYSTISSSGQSVSSLMAQFPQSIQTIFGLTGFDINTVSGYYGVLFMYLALLATVHAVLLGSGIISNEERDRTSEFLFVKPISRAKVITAKLLAGIVNIVIFNLVTMGSSMYFVDYFDNGGSMTSAIVLLMCALLLLQLLFFFIGTTIAAISRRAKAATSAATSVLLFAFILTFFINLNTSLDNLKYLTPFKYFEAKTILANGHLDPFYVLLSITVIVVAILVTYKAYAAKDLNG